MKYTYILLLTLIISCGQENETAIIEVKKQEVPFTPTFSQIDLKGTAASFSDKWSAYQKFITELENFDHTAAAAKRLTISIDDMIASVPEKLNTQPFNSRLKVLETRVKSYHALLTHNSSEIVTQQKRYDQLIVSLDQFKMQMMEVFELEKSKEDLLKNLEEMELDFKETDTINSL